MKISTAPVSSGEIMFDASRWLPEQAALAFAGQGDDAGERRGRGHVRFLELPFADAVLRRYHRGGLASRWSKDWYWWHGREATRPFREFRLTAALHEAGLPVPRPLAARYVRAGLGYRAELITERIADVHTLAEHLQSGKPIDWAAVGRLIARFHAQGFWHADLNAHNLLVDGDGQLWMIDLDRGRLRSPGGWTHGNLGRLQRSLIKLGARQRVDEFAACAWPQLLAGYRSA